MSVQPAATVTTCVNPTEQSERANLPALICKLNEKQRASREEGRMNDMDENSADRKIQITFNCSHFRLLTVAAFNKMTQNSATKKLFPSQTIGTSRIGLCHFRLVVRRKNL